MQKLLIVNVGNRNILYRGRNYAQLIEAGQLKKNLSFRHWTQEILINFDQENADLELNILPPLLEKLQGKFEVLVMFYSDQETHNDQDTIFMAQIVQKILLKKSASYKIITQKIDGSVVDNNSLLRFYRNQINFLNYKFGQPFYYICDAGGTPQCKSALKISAEFVLDQDRFKVYYVNPKNAVFEVDTDEYRSIINMEQAIVLIGKAEYLAALNILGMTLEEAINSKSLAGKILAHLYLRKNNFYKKALHNLGKFRTRDIKRSEILQLTHEKVSLGTNEMMRSFFGKEFYDALVELLYIIILHRELKDFTSLILKTSVFYEAVLNKILDLKYEYNLSGDYYNSSKKFEQDCNGGKFKIDWMDTVLVGQKEVYGASVPAMLEVLRVEKEEPVKSIFNVLIELFPSNPHRRINNLRNSLAHRGEFIDGNTLKNRAPVNFFKTLDRLIDLFELKYENIYSDLNATVISILRGA